MNFVIPRLATYLEPETLLLHDLPTQMAKLTRDTKFLIIGSRALGLCPAQMLRKQAQDFETFERDDAQKPKGWALGLEV